MRILTLHCDYIKFKALKKAVKDIEDSTDKEGEVKECLVVLTSVEQGDNEQTIKQLVEAVEKTAKEVKTDKIVLYPYAHLSSNLAKPVIALEVLQKAESNLKKNFKVTRAPFGYYKEFEFKCKGHPLAELSKTFSSSGDVEIKSKIVSKEEPVDTSKLLNQISRSKLDTSKLKDNDHRILGQRLDLFSFNEASPGNPFFHPKGQIIFNELIKLSRELQGELGYQEVNTPQVFDTKLWKVSGHWEHYKDNMFLTEYEGRSSGLKPMNCPGHMLLYKTNNHSYKDLPLRLSEYGGLHRVELSGVLNGLFRVIRLHQDDTHIFCTLEQLESEISSILSLINKIYKDIFKFKKIEVKLSTRPESFMGKKEDWDRAEDILEKLVKKSKLKYELKKGEGAFYGPKIDFDIEDSLGRKWQCSTLQLDMQLPKRFELTYTGEDNKQHTPLVIHRAIFGSLERFMGVLLEHTNGALPLWLSPRQVRIISFTDRNNKAVEKFAKELNELFPNLRVDIDTRSDTLQSRIRDAEMLKINYIVVIGDKEEENKTLAIRPRGDKPQFGVKRDKFFKDLKEEIENRN